MSKIPRNYAQEIFDNFADSLKQRRAERNDDWTDEDDEFLNKLAERMGLTSDSSYVNCPEHMITDMSIEDRVERIEKNIANLVISTNDLVGDLLDPKHP